MEYGGWVVVMNRTQHYNKSSLHSNHFKQTLEKVCQESSFVFCKKCYKEQRNVKAKKISMISNDWRSDAK